MQQWVECHPGALIHSGEVEQIVYGDRNGRHRFSVIKVLQCYRINASVLGLPSPYPFNDPSSCCACVK